MDEGNNILPTIPGAGQPILPLYTAALHGDHGLVEHLYEESRDLEDDGWNPTNRGLLLEKCVEKDMFGVALRIVKRYPGLGRNGNALRVLARKPQAFREIESNNTWTIIKSVSALMGSRVGAYENKSEALQLVTLIWEDIIAEMPRHEIESVLRGPPDSENLIHASPVQELVSEHLGKLDVETKIIMGGPSYVTKLNKALKLQEMMSAHLVNIDVETKKLIKHDIRSSFGKVDQTSNFELQKLIYNHVMDIRFELENIINKVYGEDEDQAISLSKLIFDHIYKLRALIQLDRQQHSSRLLFIAAEMGNTNFLVALIRWYPDLIWKMNDDNQTIFHVAVKYRQEGVYSLLYDIGSMKSLITLQKDADGNNMLHLVGKVTKKMKLVTMSGAALKIRGELLWFMDVRDMIPHSCKEKMNNDGLTPAELFVEEHKELIIEGEKWMRDTATQCMVAAALITTIAFAAIFTIPGGFNQDNGVPIFSQKPIFGAFVVADSMSLLLSSTSILALLSIFKSHYAEFDFVESLSKKLMFGMFTLYLSIIAIMITFSISLFMLCNKEMIWIPIMFGVLIMPVLLYSMLQYHMFLDVIRSTYGFRYLFKPKRQSTLYVNPRV